MLRGEKKNINAAFSDPQTLQRFLDSRKATKNALPYGQRTLT